MSARIEYRIVRSDGFVLKEIVEGMGRAPMHHWLPDDPDNAPVLRRADSANALALIEKINRDFLMENLHDRAGRPVRVQAVPGWDAPDWSWLDRDEGIHREVVDAPPSLLDRCRGAFKRSWWGRS